MATLEKALAGTIEDSHECKRKAVAVAKICREFTKTAEIRDPEKCREKLSKVLDEWNEWFGKGRTGVRIFLNPLPF